MRLSARGLCFGYDRPVLRRVDLDVAGGECVALLGPNGAGKTTLLRLLGGLRRPDAGVVEIDGAQLGSVDARRRAQMLGYLPQRIPAGNGFAVYEIVLMGLYPLLPASGWESRREWVSVARALRRVEAASLTRRSFDELSGGEQRRVLLARALVTRPPLLMLDEPLSALDPGFALELTDLLHALKRDGVGMVIATHQLALARSLADRVLMLRDGEVLAAGAPREVMRPEVLDRAYGTDRFSRAAAAHRRLDPLEVG